jgi:hypothetical protein
MAFAHWQYFHGKNEKIICAEEKKSDDDHIDLIKFVPY